MIKIFEESKTFILMNGTYEIRDRSLLIYKTKRSDGVSFRSPVKFPLSQIKIVKSSKGIEVTVPEWLYDDRYSSEFSPYGG